MVNGSKFNVARGIEFVQSATSDWSLHRRQSL